MGRDPMVRGGKGGLVLSSGLGLQGLLLGERVACEKAAQAVRER
jgi:hypothetical protein